MESSILGPYSTFMLLTGGRLGSLDFLGFNNESFSGFSALTFEGKVQELGGAEKAMAASC